MRTSTVEFRAKEHQGILQSRRETPLVPRKSLVGGAVPLVEVSAHVPDSVIAIRSRAENDIQQGAKV